MASLLSHLLLLGAVLSACSAADVVARIPSNFFGGTKWVLFRDENVANPPPNVIQHENDVQVLPSYQYPQKPQQPAFAGYPVHVTPAVPIVTPAPPVIAPAPPQVASAVVGDYDSEVVEAKARQQQGFQFYSQPQHHHQIHAYQPALQLQQPIVATYSVPHEAVHVKGPGYYDYLRKKKSAN